MLSIQHIENSIPKASPPQDWQAILLALVFLCFGFGIYGLEALNALINYNDRIHGVFYIWCTLHGALGGFMLLSKRIAFLIIKTLGCPNPLIWCLWLFSAYIVGGYDDSVSIHPLRIYTFKIIALTGFCIWLPLMVKHFKTNNHNTRLGLGVFGFLWLVWAIPGFFFPPFFEGIGGWKNSASYYSNPKQTYTHGFILTNTQGQSAWMTENIAAPSEFIRYYPYFAHEHGVIQNNLHGKDINQSLASISVKQCKYLLALYTYQWPRLKKGIYPRERYLGRWADADHNPKKKIDYTNFSPENIQSINRIYRYYDITQTDADNQWPIIRQDTVYSCNIQNQAFEHLTRQGEWKTWSFNEL